MPYLTVHVAPSGTTVVGSNDETEKSLPGHMWYSIAEGDR
jgi:hypothetical protein